MVKVSNLSPNRIARMKGKKVVVKFGGSSIGGMDEIDRFAQQIAVLYGLGIRPVIVHGGGPEITDEMNKNNVPVKKVAGLRITDDPTLEIAKSVLCRINDRVVISMRKAGLKCIGMAGSEVNTIVCRKMDPLPVKEGGAITMVDLGHVGEVVKVNPKTINLLCASGFVPVVYSICADEIGQIMNVNADTAAAHLAKGIKAEEMVLVTEVPGVLRVFEDATSTIKEIRKEDVEPLMSSGVLKDGMIPKVEACFIALEQGVNVAHIISGLEENSIVKQLLTEQNFGTRLTL